MKNDNRKKILLRYLFITVLIMILVGRIVYKLVDNTVLSAKEWNALAERELSRIDTIEPIRGDILAADGSVLATNMVLYTPCLDFRHPKFNEDSYRAAVPLVADSLAAHFPSKSKKEWREHLLKPLERHPDKRSRAFPVVRDVSFFESELVKTFPFPRLKARAPKKGKLIGFKVESRSVRVRPYGAMARRSIGAVGVEDTVKRVHGKFGLEKALDSYLYGKPGITKKVPLTTAIVQWNDIPPENGYSVRSTIDIKMQDIVENELNKMLEFCDAEWGSAVLLEVATGDIKAIANLEKNPSGKGEPYIESLNRVVLGWEPGSVVKTLSMLIALEDGIVTNLNEVIPLGHEWFYYGRKSIKDSHYNASLTVNEILEQSSNIGMAKIITRRYGSNPQAFHERIRSLGFLEPMNSGIAGEEVPFLSPVANNDGGRQILSRQSYGYCTEISPLYTASLYNAIANNGVYVRPRLVRGLIGNGLDTIFPVTNIRDRICSEANARILRKMLSAVVWGKHGTARAFVQSPLVRIIGKTGTANINRKGIGYTHGVNRLAFCGIFPEETPRYTCMVLVSHPKRNAMGAASTSGVVVRKVAEALYARGMLDYDDSFDKGDHNDTPYPTLYASLDPERNNRVQHSLGLGSKKAVIAAPKKHSSGLPDVMGLSLRDALKVLEPSGYQVMVKGLGCVSGQVPAAGTPVKKGSTIYLTLKE
ncbi:MAG: transpeptidase family protein [Firmicutes bacterium]|nr:transpeptidase family protein [Bacillota bacterium]MCM1401072.1 transpeptidase family protein [Bacteroides sp.]MCM1476991.1 transpeptidase family protein [Bacteroides sp.]